MTSVVAESEPDGVEVAAQVPAGRPWWGYAEEAVASLLLVAVLVVTSIGVFSRYVLGVPYTWTEPSARYLLIWLTMFGAVVLFKNRAHIEVDFLYQMLSAAGQRVLDLLSVAVQVAVGLYLLAFGWEMVQSTTATTSVPGVTLSMVYMAVPVSAVFILGYGVRDLVRAVRGPWGGGPQ